jgi:hypothetical protein
MNLLDFGLRTAMVVKLLGSCGMIWRSLDVPLLRENRWDGEFAGFAKKNTRRPCHADAFNSLSARVPEVPAYPNRANVCYRF